MLQFYEFGARLISLFSGLANFLLFEPFEWFFAALKYVRFAQGVDLPDFVWNLAADLSTVPLGIFLFGAGLTFIIIWKSICFITDIVT